MTLAWLLFGAIIVGLTSCAVWDETRKDRNMPKATLSLYIDTSAGEYSGQSYRVTLDDEHITKLVADVLVSMLQSNQESPWLLRVTDNRGVVVREHRGWRRSDVVRFEQGQPPKELDS